MVMHEQNTQSSFDFALPSMTQQSSRFGKEALFFAILPDMEAIEACIAVQDGLPLRGVDGRQERSGAAILAACWPAGAIDACQFELGFDHVATFRVAGAQRHRARRQWRPRTAAAAAYPGSVSRCIISAKVRESRPDFQPHVTLFYDRDVPKTTLDKPGDDGSAREFVLLIRNRPGESGYDTGRWPLRCADNALASTAGSRLKLLHDSDSGSGD
jgi:hypothetical protein